MKSQGRSRKSSKQLETAENLARACRRSAREAEVATAEVETNQQAQGRAQYLEACIFLNLTWKLKGNLECNFKMEL